MKRSLSEREIETQILMWLKAKGIMAWKIKSTGFYDVRRKCFRKDTGPYRLGVADILGIYKGKPLACEVKAKKGLVSDLQREFLEEFAREGGIAFVARSVEDVERVLRVVDESL